MHPKEISIQDYTYHLPEEKIALHPLPQRDASKLLIYKKGKLEESVFKNITDFLPENTLLIFNNTKVINARLRFKKASGASIEIFCLEPAEAINEYSSIMSKTQTVRWKCFIGGASKWKNELLEKKIVVDGKTITLYASLIEKIPDAYIVALSWQPSHYSFACIIDAAGDVPLPPYIKRNTEIEDTNRYQTIFAKEDGSVAAPTAGLHFTENIFKKMKEKNIEKSFVTLHVGAGTFKPVKAATMQGHDMHSEYIDVSVETIRKLISNTGNIAAVGTTSLRTIETLYWLGVKASLQPELKNLQLHQWDVYLPELVNANMSAAAALEALADWMKKNNLQQIFTKTQLLIAPGYTFRMASMLITNFHQPQSTLLLLVAAAIGNHWKEVYNYALENNFRFLSYGDGNLIFMDTLHS
ncbi:MAG: S-adenosylmethionine:tRNA ribosyltransferase-isomerase [Bacteroidetes bacterium]|nr:S-adenosylmethionine:tRNA ribosyltransferase-isomerase [Bacteroidota bacterium]MBS1757802.1 S-adenosylmethionine:tRNA ribosyltransferase-isomerase [Bacteroidota bacterium]